VAEAAEAYVADRVSRGELRATSAHQVRWRLAGLVAACPPAMAMADLDRPAILEWQRGGADHRPATRRAALSAVRTFCLWAVDEGLLAADPTRGLVVREPRTVPRALSESDLSRLLAVLPDLRARLVVALMARQGLRCVEVSRLEVADWDRDASSLRVRGKGDHERGMPVADDVASLLTALVGERRSGPIIGLSAGRISILVSRWMNAAGIKGASYDGKSAHALRHSAASDFYERSGDMRATQRLLGHANLATTDRYLRHADDPALRAGLNLPSYRTGRKDEWGLGSTAVEPDVALPGPPGQRPRLVLVPPGPVPSSPGRSGSALVEARRRVAASAEAERAAAAVLNEARAERLAAARAAAELADAARLYWETDMSARDIAALLGLPPGQKRAIHKLVGPSIGKCPRCGYPQATRYSRSVDWGAVDCPACEAKRRYRECH
jgi:integrase/recombinase XerC